MLGRKQEAEPEDQERKVLYRGRPDANRGWNSRKHETLGYVYKYFDDPGVYFFQKSDFLVEATAKEAKEAGFDVTEDLEEKEIRAATAEFEEQMRAGKAEIVAKIRKKGIDPTVGDELPQHPLVTKKTASGEPRGTALFDITYGGGQKWWDVKDASGKFIAKKLSKVDAYNLMIERTEKAQPNVEA